MKKCLVLGGAGFIGSHLADRLIEDGHDVTVIDDLSTGKRENIVTLLKHKNFTMHREDLTSLTREKIFQKGFDWIFHLAGRADLIPSIKNPAEYHNVNVNGTLVALEMAKLFGCEKFVYAASSTCYGIPEEYPSSEEDDCYPEHPYGLTKHVGEQYVMHWAKVYKVPAISLRLFNVFGLRSRTNGNYGAVFGVFLSQLANNKPFTVVGDGTQKRDFVYVRDVVDAFVEVANSNFTRETFNIGSGRPRSINELVHLLNPVAEIEYLPKRPGEPEMTYADTSRIKKLLKWEPKTSFEEGVEIMRRNKDLWKNAPLWDKKSIQRATQSWFEHL